MNEPEPEPEITSANDPLSRAIPGIMLAVAVWGGYLAVGAFFNGGESSYRPALKGLILAGSFLLFLGFWAAMLYFRRSQIEKED